MLLLSAGSLAKLSATMTVEIVYSASTIFTVCVKFWSEKRFLNYFIFKLFLAIHATCMQLSHQYFTLWLAHLSTMFYFSIILQCTVYINVWNVLFNHLKIEMLQTIKVVWYTMTSLLTMLITKVDCTLLFLVCELHQKPSVKVNLPWL